MSETLFALDGKPTMSEGTKNKVHYIRAARRRFGYQYGDSVCAVKEYISRQNLTPALSFVFALAAEDSTKAIERRVRQEILKRIGDQA